MREDDGAPGPTLRRLDAGDHRLFIVTLPGPSRPTEAWMTCLAYAVRRSILGATPGARRYFTLERGADPATKATVRFFCEWVGARERHVNHGVTDVATVEEFADLVKAALAAPSPAAGPAGLSGTAAASARRSSRRR
jgi:hypothetical protein